MSSLATATRQMVGLYRIYIQDGLAYKAAGFIWILTDVTTAVTMPLVWLAASKTGTIAGFTGSDLVVYYLCMLLVSCFVVCHYMWDISQEIKEGAFSAQIIRPVPYLRYILARNFAWRCVRTSIFLPFFVLILWGYSASLGSVRLNLSWEFWLSLAFGHTLSVVFVTGLAMIALFVEEAHSIFEIYYIPMLFLSGQLFPMDLFPAWVKNLAIIFPFYYTTGAPTEIVTGRVAGPDVFRVLAVQVAWIAFSYVMFKVLFRYGTRRYTGVGM